MSRRGAVLGAATVLAAARVVLTGAAWARARYVGNVDALPRITWRDRVQAATWALLGRAVVFRATIRGNEIDLSPIPTMVHGCALYGAGLTTTPPAARPVSPVLFDHDDHGGTR